MGPNPGRLASPSNSDRQLYIDVAQRLVVPAVYAGQMHDRVDACSEISQLLRVVHDVASGCNYRDLR
jgi:hypothetical protein